MVVTLESTGLESSFEILLITFPMDNSVFSFVLQNW